VKPEDAEALDPFKLVLAIPKEKLPHIYFDCGTEDRLIGSNRDFAKHLMGHGLPFVFGESAGGHAPPYWTREVRTSMAVQYAALQRNLAARDAKPKEPAKTERDSAKKEEAAVKP
jgi:S-formylglutathione hydrolase FrmB